jgi:hypothetical protein
MPVKSGLTLNIFVPTLPARKFLDISSRPSKRTLSAPFLRKSECQLYVEYMTFGELLHTLGFTEDASEGAPICRWQHGEIKLDLMPLDEKILGFSNRWYKSAMDSAQEFEIGRDVRIRVVTASYFCATKLEAFKGCGKGDYLSSHDLEDLITSWTADQNS